MEFLSISQVQALGCYIEEDQEDQITEVMI